MLSMPPLVEEVWGEHHKLRMSPSEKPGSSWPATPGKVHREVPSRPEAPELPLMAEPPASSSSRGEGPLCRGQRRWGGWDIFMRRHLGEAEGWPEFTMRMAEFSDS